jgi:hypothetical protein
MTRDSGSTDSPKDTHLEQALLLACSRTQIDDSAASGIRALAATVTDWPSLTKAAANHKVWPLLYRALVAVCPEVLPPEVMDSLRKEYLGHGVRNLRRARELVQVMNALRERNIPCLAYKGPVLAECVYGDLSLRQFVDLDVLVRRSSLGAALETLATLGYALQLEKGAPKAAYLQSMHHYALAHEDGGMLELHWDIAERYFAFSLPTEDLWERRQTARLIKQEIFTLRAEDNLIALAVHGCKHGWEQLSLVCDVAELARVRQDMDWALALRRARDKGGERMVLLALRLAHDALEAPLPDIVRQRMDTDPAAGRIAAQVRARLFAPDQSTPDASERVRFFRLHIQARERFRDRARSLLHLIFTPSQEDWESLALPNSLSFLHYLFRPLRLAAKHAGRLIPRL